MAKWIVKTKAYDYEDEDMVKGGLMRAGVNYIKKLEKEKQTLTNSFLELNETKDSFMMTQFKIEINNVTQSYINNNKKMSMFIQDKEIEILSLFEKVLEDDDNSARLADFYLYNITLENKTDKLIRIISYTPTTKKGYIDLYQMLYHEIKRTIEWYYVNDESKVIQWKFYNSSNYTGKYIELFNTKFNFIPINTTEKPIRKAAALITYLLTNKKPDTKNKIEQDNLHSIL